MRAVARKLDAVKSSLSAGVSFAELLIVATKMHALTLSLIVCSATAFSPQVALRAQHLSLRAQHSRRAHTVLVERSSLSPVPIQTKAKSLLIPAIGYAGVAGVALGAQQLVENYMGGYDLTTYMGVPLPIAAIVIPALVLLGEFALG